MLGSFGPGARDWLAALLLMVLTNAAQGQCEFDKLRATDGLTLDRFGAAVAIDGDRVLVSAADEQPDGAVYDFARINGSWSETQKIEQDGFAGFGSSVSINGNVAIIGTFIDGCGAAFVYRHDGSAWVFEQMLQPDDCPAGGRFFGSAVAVEGDVAIVGAHGDETNGSLGGAAYVFRFDGFMWNQEQKLLPTDGHTDARFGWSVALAGGAVVIGAPGDDANGGADAGAAYVFAFDGLSWSQTQKLLASDAGAGAAFGHRVAIAADGQRLLVGAPVQSVSAAMDGAAYCFAFDGASWVETQRLCAANAMDGMAFGSSVALGGDVAVIGASNPAGVGSVHVFLHDGASWNLALLIDAPDGVNSSAFGQAAAISGHVLVVGAEGDDQTDIDAGAAYLFAAIEDCNGNGVIDCVDIAEETSSDLDGSGRADECELLAYNTVAATAHPTIAEAIIESLDGHTIIASPLLFPLEVSIDFLGRDIRLKSMRDIHQPADGVYTLTDGVRLATDDAYAMMLHGELRAVPGALVDVTSGLVAIEPGGQLIAEPDSTIACTANLTQLAGLTRIESGAVFSVAGMVRSSGMLLLQDATMHAQTMLNTGSCSLDQSVLFAGTFLNGAGGIVDLNGSIQAEVTNNDALQCAADAMIDGGCVNHGMITIHAGTLTVTGSLANHGTIVAGDPARRSLGGVSEGDGMDVLGDCVITTEATLAMPDVLWQLNVGGDFDVAINDHANYHMALATLGMTSITGAAQQLEVMSSDIGPTAAGLDPTLPGHFPIGTLRLGGSAVVDLVDNHDNDDAGPDACEAIYVQTLFVPEGAMLNTNGCRVYYTSAFVAGAVDDPGNLVQIGTCPGDANGDLVVDLDDLLDVIGNWGSDGSGGGDVNGDGSVNLDDLLAVIGNWGSVC